MSATLDEGLSRAVQTIFAELYDQGLTDRLNPLEAQRRQEENVQSHSGDAGEFLLAADMTSPRDRASGQRLACMLHSLPPILHVAAVDRRAHEPGLLIELGHAGRISVTCGSAVRK